MGLFYNYFITCIYYKHGIINMDEITEILIYAVGGLVSVLICIAVIIDRREANKTRQLRVVQS